VLDNLPGAGSLKLVSLTLMSSRKNLTSPRCPQVLLKLEWAKWAKQILSHQEKSLALLLSGTAYQPLHQQHQLTLILLNSPVPELFVNCFWVPVTQVPRDSCLGFTRTCTEGIFVGSERETCLKPHSKSISTQESSPAIPAPAVSQTPLPFHMPFGCCQKYESILTRKPLKATACIYVLFTWSLLQRKDLLHIFSSCLGPPGDDSSIAMLSCLLMDSVSTFPLQILEDLISTL